MRLTSTMGTMGTFQRRRRRRRSFPSLLSGRGSTCLEGTSLLSPLRLTLPYPPSCPRPPPSPPLARSISRAPWAHAHAGKGGTTRGLGMEDGPLGARPRPPAPARAHATARPMSGMRTTGVDKAEKTGEKKGSRLGQRLVTQVERTDATKGGPAGLYVREELGEEGGWPLYARRPASASGGGGASVQLGIPATAAAVSGASASPSRRPRLPPFGSGADRGRKGGRE